MTKCFRNWILAVAAVGSITAAQGKDSPPSPMKLKDHPAFEVFFEAFLKVMGSYVEEIPVEKLVQHAIHGMVNLDPHSIYLTPKEFEGLLETAKGEFGGLGIEVTQEYGVVKVITPIDDTPAYAAGIKSGDYIIWINDKPVAGMTLQEATDKMRGAKGTTVKLRIVRDNMEPFDISVKRDIIKIRPVKHRVEGNIGYIRIGIFNENTADLIQEAVKDIKAKLKDNLLGFVLDMRNNPGGVLEQATAVSDLFLDQGEIVSLRYRDPKNIERFNATYGDIARGLPIAVLINGGSASAAEIVAGALKDHKRAIIMGNRSFGKGSVQVVLPLNNKKGGLKVTVGRYYPPSGHPIQGNGVTPDVVIHQAKVEFLDEKRRRERDLKGSLKANPVLEEENKKIEDDENAEENAFEKRKKEEAEHIGPKSEGSAPLKRPSSEDDYQLARALDLLKAYATFTHASSPLSKAGKDAAKNEVKKKESAKSSLSSSGQQK